MGVQLSVDDVGTNWSSFEPFKRHSISTVKIDGSFIAGLESNQGINRLVVETVIHMAHSLGMSAIVERVETAAQVEIVRAFDADAAQGFFFSRPMSSEDAAAFAAGPEVPQFSADRRSHDAWLAGRRARAPAVDVADADRRAGTGGRRRRRRRHRPGSRRAGDPTPGGDAARRRPPPGPTDAPDRPASRPATGREDRRDPTPPAPTCRRGRRPTGVGRAHGQARPSGDRRDPPTGCISRAGSGRPAPNCLYTSWP